MAAPENKVAIVTGGAGGIGAATAAALAEAGMAVALADWQAEPVEQQAQSLRERGYQALGLAADISRRAEVERMVGQVVEAFGRVDVLVNNAGINPPHQAPFLEMSDETWARTIDVNLTGMFLCSQIAGRVMAKQRAGSIVNITSIGALRPTPGGVAYHASKGGVISFTLALAVNLAPYQIRANAIGPGYVATAMTGGMADPEARARTLTRVPLDRVGQPEDIANAVTFLASDKASYITGQVFYVDGGAMALGQRRLPPLEDES
jgi:NAD(P)-dependent dehydrogenase (short-subunit alcohol dehydrogenase family)